MIKKNKQAKVIQYIVKRENPNLASNITNMSPKTLQKQKRKEMS